jgi:M6 family metalloprotease-like protein
MKQFVLLIFCFLAGTSHVLASPYNGQVEKFKQPDGSMVDVRLYGTEFYMRAEGLDDYTLIRDKKTGWICYANLSADKKQLVSTGIKYMGIENNTATLRSNLSVPKHLDISDEARIAEVKKNRKLLENTGNKSTLKTNSIDHRVSGTPSGLITGTITGLCIVVDFSDEVGTLQMSDFDSFCNDLTYTGFGNNGSLRKFYKDVSGGLLDYQNVVYGYYRAPLTFATYDAMPYAQGAQQILGQALAWLDAQGFDFSTLSTNPDGTIMAINLMYTGNPPTWAQGMWHHKGNYTGFTADGVTSNDYNCSPAGSPLRLAVVAHENGHMIGKWPDTYKYTSTNGPDGIGGFDLMCDYGSYTNPTIPNPLFRSNAGWGRVVDVTYYNGINTDTANSRTCYKYRNLNDTNEFFLIENRMKTGRSQYIPTQGLTIWHIDRNGDNQTTHHEVWLEHANNNYTSESGATFKATLYPEYSYSTTPGSNFYNGNQSGLRVWDIGPIATNMTYKLGAGFAAPTLNLMYISLTGDNNANGFIEPAESADIHLNSANFGQVSTGTASITCTSIGVNAASVTVNSPVVSVGIINVNQTVPATFNISVAAGTPIGTEIELKFELSDGTFSTFITKKLIVGVQVFMSDQSVNTCEALFYDASGESNYNNNTDYVKTIYPASVNNMIKADFVEFDLEDEASCSYDFMMIYDGPNSAAPYIGMYCGANSPGTITSTHPSGALTFAFHSDEGLTMSGWKAIISCINVAGIKTNSMAQFSVFPNPSTGLYSVRFNNMVNEGALVVTDVVGKEVYNSNITAKENVNLDLSALPGGMYFLSLNVKGEVMTKKLMLNR